MPVIPFEVASWTTSAKLARALCVAPWALPTALRTAPHPEGVTASGAPASTRFILLHGESAAGATPGVSADAAGGGVRGEALP